MVCVGVIDILVLGRVFVVEVGKGVVLVVGCVVRLVLWCVNGRGYILCRFKMKSVEMNALSVGGFPFGMVIWADCFVLLERGFLGKMVGMEVLIEAMVEVLVLDVVQAGFFCLFLTCLLRGYDGCESRDRGCGWCAGVGLCGGVGVVEMVGSVIMGVGIGGVGNRGGGVVNSGENVSVTDGGDDGGGARWRDCCRFPHGIFGELRENLPYLFPFMLDIGDVFL